MHKFLIPNVPFRNSLTPAVRAVLHFAYVIIVLASAFPQRLYPNQLKELNYLCSLHTYSFKVL